MLVKAAAGLKVPMEEKPRDYIGDADAVEVPETAYYVRRFMDGDLVVVGPAPVSKKSKE